MKYKNVNSQRVQKHKLLKAITILIQKHKTNPKIVLIIAD
jgi:hypothetical protein